MNLARIIGLCGALTASSAFSQESIDPGSQRWKNDSIWTVHRNSISIFVAGGTAFGDHLDLEKQFAKDLDFRVVSTDGSKNEAVDLSMNVANFGVLGRRLVTDRLDVGLGYRYREETINSQAREGATVLTSNDILFQSRYWVFRDQKVQIGPRLGVGYSFGSLHRLPLEQDATFAEPGLTETDKQEMAGILRKINTSVSADGIFLDLGAAAEAQFFSRFVVGSALSAGRSSLGLPSTDPAKKYLKSYSDKLVDWNVVLELQGSLLF